MTSADPGSHDWAAPVPTSPELDQAPLGSSTGQAETRLAPQQPPAQAGVNPPQPPTYRSWQPGIVALRPMPFGEFLTVPFKALRFNRGVIIGGPLLMVAIAILASGVAGWLTVNDSRLDLLSVSPNFTGVEASTVVAWVIAIIVSFFSDMLATAIVVPAVSHAVMGKRIGLPQSLKLVSRRLGRLILLYLAVGALSVVFAALIFAPILLIANETNVGLGIALIFLAVIISIPVFTLVGIYLPVVRGVMVLENQGLATSIKRAVTLMKGRFWWTFLILAVLGIISYSIVQVLAFGTQILAIIPTAIAPENMVIFGIVFGLSLVIQLVFQYILQYSVVGTAQARIYIDLRFRKEGLALDIARAAEAQFANQQSGRG